MQRVFQLEQGRGELVSTRVEVGRDTTRMLQKLFNSTRGEGRTSVRGLCKVLVIENESRYHVALHYS